jgi:hypothetical protein
VVQGLLELAVQLVPAGGPKQYATQGQGRDGSRGWVQWQQAVYASSRPAGLAGVRRRRSGWQQRGDGALMGEVAHGSHAAPANDR